MEKVKSPNEFDNLIEMMEYFKDNETCVRYLEEWRWKGEPSCPYCECKKVYKFKTKKQFECSSCKKRFSATVKTIFENSKISLRKWYIAMYFIANNKKGISSYRLAKTIGVTQKSAWFMLHRLRYTMRLIESKEHIRTEGATQIDETFVGGKNANRHKNKKVESIGGRSFKDKTPVVGLYEHGGNVRCFVIPDTTIESLQPIIHNYIKHGSTIVTDEWKGYKGLGKYYNHEIVDHERKNYVNDCGWTTNHIEGIWSLLKRSIMGCYHNVTKKHLQRYVDEMTFRFNNKDASDGEKVNIMMSLINCRLNYNQLINHNT